MWIKPGFRRIHSTCTWVHATEYCTLGLLLFPFFSALCCWAFFFFLALRGEDICWDITFHVSTFEEPPAAVHFHFISSSSGSLSSYPPSLASFTSIHHICVYLRLVDVLPQELLHSPSCSPTIITFFFLITLSPALSCFFSLLPGTFFFFI